MLTDFFVSLIKWEYFYPKKYILQIKFKDYLNAKE